MTNGNGKLRVGIGIAASLLTCLLSVGRVRADEGSTSQGSTSRRSPGMSERTTHETMVVTGIDRSNRSVMLQNADGDKRTVNVPTDVKAFDTLKVGDRVDIDYYESMAVSLAPPGSKPSVSTRSASSRMAEGGRMAGKETTITAEVLSIDVPGNKVTFKGPQGNARTVDVNDPALQKKLPMLKPGQHVQFTYTEAVAASIRPAPPK
jgi:hypothetical protein